MALIRVANDLARHGCFGERTLWNDVAEAVGAEIEDYASTGATSWSDLKAACWRLPRPDLGIQNATWAAPRLAGDAPYVAILQDNIRRMWNDPDPQHRTLSEAAAIVCNGPLIRADYADYAEGVPMHVIPIGIDVDYWTPPLLPIHRERLMAVFVGDGFEHKGWTYVRTLAARRRDLDWVFVMKQGSADAAELGTLIVGASRDQVRAALRRADVFVLASPVETQCLAALEAMACGLPVVMPSTGVFYDWRPPSFYEATPQHLDAFDAALSRALAERATLSPRRELIAAKRFTRDECMNSWLILARKLVQS